MSFKHPSYPVFRPGEPQCLSPCPVHRSPSSMVIKNGKLWEVHWDYQESRASGILFRRRDYPSGYIESPMDMIRIKSDQMLCASDFTGTVKRLDEFKAEQHRAVLHQILVPLVETEHQRQEKFQSLPHVPLADATEK